MSAEGSRKRSSIVLPLLAGTVVLGAALFAGLRFSRAREHQVMAQERAEVQNRVNGIGTSLASAVNRRQAIVAGLAAFTELHRDDEDIAKSFSVYAAGLHANDPSIRLIQVYFPDRPQLAYPTAGNESVLARRLGDLVRDERPQVRADVERTIATRRITLSDPYPLRQGGLGVVARQAVARNGEVFAMAVVILNVPPLLENAGLLGSDLELDFALQDSTGHVFFGDASVHGREPVICRMPLPEGYWTLAVAPRGGWPARIQAHVASARLAVVPLAVLLGGAAFLITRRLATLARAVRRQTRELGERAQDSLRLSAEADAARAMAERSRAEIAETLEHISDGFATLDREWRYTFVNPRLAEMVGRRREELVGRQIWSLYPEAVGTSVHAAYQRAMLERQVTELEHFYAPFGRWFQHRFYPSPTGLSVFVRDITDRKQVEAALRASEAQFRVLVKEAPLPMCFTSGDGVFRVINDRFVQLFGYTVEDMPTLERWWQLAYPDPSYRDEVRVGWGIAMAQAKQGRVDLGSAEYRVTGKDGTVRCVEISGATMLGGFLAMFVDVTQRRQAEEQLRRAEAEAARLLGAAEKSQRALLSVIEDQKESQAALRANEERYRNLVETSFDWVWETDTKSRYTYSSPQVKDLLGYEVAEVLGRTPFELMPEAEAKRVLAIFQTTAEARQPFVAIENTNRHRDGHLVVLETNGVPVFAADGAWLGYRGMDRDITARRAAEMQLRLHGAALEAAANAVVITNRRGAIEWVNPAFTALSGWSLAEVEGKNPRVFLKSGQHDNAFYAEMWQTLNAGQVWRGEIVNRRKDGQLRTEDMTITPLRGVDGRITHFIAIKQDITDQRAMEMQFLQAQRLEAIGTLAGGIAHDLNNILAPILMVTDVVKDKLVDDEDRELIATMQSSARRGAAIIKQLLAFSRGHLGERVVVQPRHLIKEMMTIMRETFPREIDLRHEIAAELWTVIADPTQLHQVLLNLCVNARDAMPTGGSLTVTAANATLTESDLALQPGMRPGRHVVVAVADSGSGIPPEIKHRIFDPFFTTKELGKGTGLGLSTVLGIVQNHRGFILVDSEPGQGSTFKVFLPANPESADAPAEASAAPARPAEAPRRGEGILVVDDEREVRDVARYILEQQHFRVITASHGRDGTAQFLRHRDEISLVLTDLMMPVMNGLALIRALRALDPTLRIVAMSGLSEGVDRRELEALGVTDVLLKPFDAAALLDFVQSRLPPK